VPLNTPAVESVSPAGTLPEKTVKVYGPRPPLAVSVWLYAAPSVPPGSVAGLTVTVAAPTTTEYARVPVEPPDEVAFTVKLNVPTVLAVPLNTPAVESVSPAGTLPEKTAKVYGPRPPLAVNVWL